MTTTFTSLSTEAPTTQAITHPQIDYNTEILGEDAAIFAIIIIFILVYSVKKYRKRRIYRPPLRDFIHEGERVVCCDSEEMGHDIADHINCIIKLKVIV